MNFSPEQKQIDEAFEKLRKSNLFKRSSVHERILSFLIEKALLGEDVKEQLIGIELFKEKYTADQNDSKIRVYVYYLRKKLKAYYAGLGKDETIRFEIQKGQYNLTFVQNKEEEIEVEPTRAYYQIRLPKRVAKITILSVMLAAVLILAKPFFTEQYCWKSFLNEDNTVCVVADHFMVRESSRTSGVYSFYDNVKSLEKLNEYHEQQEYLNLHSGGFTLLSKMAPYGLKTISDWFKRYNADFDIQLESETLFSDYQKYNVIYIGQGKVMNATAPYFLKSSKRFSLSKSGYIYSGDGQVKSYVAQHNKVEHYEHVMVSYSKLGNGVEALFFVSDHDIGVMATVKKFTDRTWLKAFYKNLSSTDAEFNALFKVTGLRRTELSCELVELEEIK